MKWTESTSRKSRSLSDVEEGKKKMFEWVFIAVGASLIAYALFLWGIWKSDHKTLRFRVRRLDDGRFRVSYEWSFWEWEPNVEIWDEELVETMLPKIVLDSLGREPATPLESKSKTGT